MKQISISFLKKEAKLLRKHNLNIKNHNDSLNEISKKYGFDKWQDLIDNCHLNFESNSTKETTNPIQHIESSVNETIDTDIKRGSLILKRLIQDIKKKYLYLLKVEDSNPWLILSYLKSLVRADTQMDKEKEQKIFPLIEYLLICYCSIKGLRNIHLEDIFELSRPESEYFMYQSFFSINFDNTFLFENLNIEPSDYFNNIDPGFKSNNLGTHSFHGVPISESGFKKHYQNYMSIKRIAKYFKIFQEIRSLTKNQNIDEAVSEWLCDYNNVNRYIHFGIDLDRHASSFCVDGEYIHFINNKDCIKDEEFHAQILSYVHQNK